MLASSISQGSGAGWPGILCRGPTWLTARLRMSSHLILLLLLDSSHCDFVVMDTLRIWLGLIRSLTLLSRHHSPSLSIADQFNKKLQLFYYDMII